MEIQTRPDILIDAPDMLVIADLITSDRSKFARDGMAEIRNPDCRRGSPCPSGRHHRRIETVPPRRERDRESALPVPADP